MTEHLTDKVREYIDLRAGKEIDVGRVRVDLRINPDSNAWNGIYTVFNRLVSEKKLRPSGKKDGIYKVISQVKPVQIFSVNRERRPPYDLRFPRNFDTMMEMDFAESVIVREGDLILISGVSNLGKTGVCLNFCGENIDKQPVLMGNEYTNPLGEPMPRFLSRLDTMDIRNGGWVDWIDGEGNDKFILLPVRDDYAEHIVKDRINIIDWINIETGEHYMIGTILDGIKRQLGKGVAIIAIQKAEGADAGRGGQFTKDFADCELLIDKLGATETLLTIGKVKESSKPIMGKTYGFGISRGVKIINFREVKRCSECHGKRYTPRGECEECQARGFQDA